MYLNKPQLKVKNKRNFKRPKEMHTCKNMEKWGEKSALNEELNVLNNIRGLFEIL